MTRTKLFISYCHRDGDWLERLKVHLALLERRGLLQLWSDSRVGAGRWRGEMESALAESRVAVLLVTPDFLASESVWNYAIPRMLGHRTEGMEILPLIAKPCAWRMASELADLAAWPADARPLALLTDTKIDMTLSQLAYELAGRLTGLPIGIAGHDENFVLDRQVMPFDGNGLSSAQTKTSWLGESETLPAPIEQGQAWIGSCSPVDNVLRLVVLARNAQSFHGNIEYPQKGSVTEIEGDVHDCTVAFRETGPTYIGRYPRKYAGWTTGSAMLGICREGATRIGVFRFRLVG